jgi:cytoskeleton protein RodZ
MVSPVAGALPRDRDVAAQPGQRALTFRFKGDSWVEVRDTRSGRLLLTGTHAAGSEAQVNARPPFSVVVGNTANVQLTIDNQAFSLEPHSRVGVARFTIE